MSAVTRYDPAYERMENIKATAFLSLLGLGAAAAGYMGLKSLIKKLEANNQLKHSTDEGDPATYATQFKMAFENDNWLGWGTNLTQVYATITAIPSKKSYSKVQASYKALYNRNLNADLMDELSTDEYNKFISILAAKKNA
jgi:hypothetical protein